MHKTLATLSWAAVAVVTKIKNYIGPARPNNARLKAIEPGSNIWAKSDTSLGGGGGEELSVGRMSSTVPTVTVAPTAVPISAILLLSGTDTGVESVDMISVVTSTAVLGASATEIVARIVAGTPASESIVVRVEKSAAFVRRSTAACAESAAITAATLTDKRRAKDRSAFFAAKRRRVSVIVRDTFSFGTPAAKASFSINMISVASSIASEKEYVTLTE
mmetsp:Transcript_59599/g.109188  ORF Transcript_59599/g.109188 Transcript_59599/m.109188 type:complete len:219 (-) Transcript_59599:184-840(-)